MTDRIERKRERGQLGLWQWRIRRRGPCKLISQASFKTLDTSKISYRKLCRLNHESQFKGVYNGSNVASSVTSQGTLWLNSLISNTYSSPHRDCRSKVWVNGQYVYPVRKQTKRDRRRTKLVRDTFYIDGEAYIHIPCESISARLTKLVHDGTPSMDKY